MNINAKRVFRKTILTLLLLNLFSFLVYYVTTISLENTVTVYIKSYYAEIADALLPIYASVALYVIYSASGIRSALICAPLLSLSWVIYFFPYYAFDYALRGAYIDEVFYYSALASLISILIVLLKITIFFLCIAFFTRLWAKKIKLSKKKYACILENRHVFDFSEPLTVGFFAAALLLFLYNLGFELYSTVTFIIDVTYSYSIITTGEILYIAFRYVFILALLLLSHIGSYIVKNRLLQGSDDDGEEKAHGKNEAPKSEEIINDSDK